MAAHRRRRRAEGPALARRSGEADRSTPALSRLRRRSDGKAAIAVGVSEDMAKRFNAVELLKKGVEAVGGKGGGGRPDMAQGGGPDGTKLQAALDAIAAAIKAWRVDTRTHAGGDAVSWRRWIYLTIEAGGSSAAAHYFDDFMVVLIVANVLAVILESVPSIHAAFRDRVLGVRHRVGRRFSPSSIRCGFGPSIEIPAIRQRGSRAWAADVCEPAVADHRFSGFRAVLFCRLSCLRLDLRVLRMFRLLRFLKLVRYSPAMVTLGRALYEERRALIGAHDLDDRYGGVFRHDHARRSKRSAARSNSARSPTRCGGRWRR